MFPEERAKGIYDADPHTPASITAHGPGYISEDDNLIVGLQTDAPLKRAIMPNGGWRMVEGALETYGYEVDQTLKAVYTYQRKTHNQGVFDVYPPSVRAARSSHIITGLPDAYGRGRIIGDYRRVALYGVDALIQAKKLDKLQLDTTPFGEEVLRMREEHSEQLRALGELKQMAASYGIDISGPATTAREAVQWLYFGYLGAVKEQNGAAMSLGRTSTFLDVFIERDLAAGAITEQQAQELIDDFVIKLRIVRFLRTPEYDALFSGDPTWVTESIGGMGEDGRSLVTKNSFRYLQTLYNLGPAPEPNMTVFWSSDLPRGFKDFCASVSIDTSAVQYESDDLIRGSWGDDAAIACCVSPMRVGKQMQFFGARVNLAKTLLYAINGGRDEVSGKQVAPAVAPVADGVLDFDDVMARFDSDDGLARRDLCGGAELHPLVARQVRVRAPRDGAARQGSAAHDGLRHRRTLGGDGLAVGDQVRQGHPGPRRPRHRGRLRHRGRVPDVRQRRRSRRRHRRRPRRAVHHEGAPAPDVSQRGADAVGADDHVERGLWQGDRQHARRPPRRRAVRAGREPDERTRHARDAGIRPLRRQAALRAGGGWDLADQHGGAERTRPHA